MISEVGFVSLEIFFNPIKDLVRPWALKLGDGQNLRDNSFGIGKLVLLNMRRVNGGRIDGADPLDGGIEIIESVFLNQGRNLRRNSTKGL